MTHQTTFRSRLRRWVMGLQLALVLFVFALVFLREFGGTLLPTETVQTLFTTLGL
jgi:hypothetical protein